MPTSSAASGTTLIPDERLQRSVLGIAAALYVAGVCLLVRLDLTASLTLVAVLVWSIDVARECRVIWSGLGKIAVLEFGSDGVIRLHSCDGSVRPARLRNGSVVTRRLAWLRLRDSTGTDRVFLLRATTQAEPAWRRFQLLWQLARRNFGRTPVS